METRTNTDKARRAYVKGWENYLTFGGFPTETNTGLWGEPLAQARREWRQKIDQAMAAEA